MNTQSRSPQFPFLGTAPLQVARTLGADWSVPSSTGLSGNHSQHPRNSTAIMILLSSVRSHSKLSRTNIYIKKNGWLPSRSTCLSSDLHCHVYTGGQKLMRSSKSQNMNFLSSPWVPGWERGRGSFPAGRQRLETKVMSPR